MWVVHYLSRIMWKERTRKPHPNPKPLEKLRIVDGGPFFPHDPLSHMHRSRYNARGPEISLIV